MATKIEDAPEYLSVKAVEHVIGKTARSIRRLLTAGRLEKIGRGRAVRISLTSVLRYLDEERELAKAAKTVSAAVGVNLAKGRAMVARKQQEDKLKRALEKVNTGTATETPETDPRFETVKFEGIIMAACERDEILMRRRRAALARYMAPQLVRAGSYYDPPAPAPAQPAPVQPRRETPSEAIERSMLRTVRRAGSDNLNQG